MPLVDLTPIRVPASLLPLTRALSELWTPPSRLPLSQWAEANMVLSSEYAARASRLRLYQWQRDPFDAITDPSVSEVVLCTSVQMLKTIAIQAAIAYAAVEDPGPILLLEPKEDSCLAFSKRRLTPMIRDMACLHGIMSGSLHSSSGSTLLSKDFPGGNLLIVSANTPVDVAQHTVRYVFCDEPDKYPPSAGKEGDPMDLAWERAATFGSRKKRIQACSPTVAGRSRIGNAYKNSDQRKPWVPCFKCGQYQILKFFPDAGGTGGVRWDSSVARERQPATAYYECSFCSAHWNDNQRWAACGKTEWRAEKPFQGVAGFWINHLYSPWKRLSDIVKHFLRVKDDRLQYQVFINAVLAQEWQEDGETPDAELLYNRREDYAYGESAVVPLRGLFLTASVDVQDSPPRLEVEVVAWGRGRERWSICYQTLQLFAENGQPLPVTSPGLWNVELARVLNRDYPHESGHTLPIMAMAIDTGKRPKPVYDFARRHPQLSYSAGSGLRLHAIRTVIPVKGNDDAIRIISTVSKEDAMKKRQGVRIVIVGTHCAKQQIFDILKHVKPSRDGSPVPDCYHFPRYDMPYFDGLCAEIRVVDDKGKVKYVRRPGSGRNEPLDIAVYGRAAAAIVGIDRFSETHWQQLERALDPSTVLHSSLEGVNVPASAPSTIPNPPRAGDTECADPKSALSADPAPPVSQQPTPNTAPRRPTRPTRGSFTS